jgi:tetratricopeptide (TPR) repeat protein
MPRVSFRSFQLVFAFSILAIGAIESRSQDSSASSADGDEARAAMLRRDYTTAESLYRRDLERNPASAELLTNLGIALQMQGRASEAIPVFEHALKEKYLPQTYALLAEQRCISHDLDGARPMLSKIIRDYAGEEGIIAVVAPCYLDLDEPVESVRAYTVLLRDESYPHDVALIQLAKSYLAAAQYFITKLQGRSDSKAYLTALGQASASGDPRSAFPIAKRASPNFHADLGTC